MVIENMFGDILSDLPGGLVGGMGMAACAEIGDKNGLFQPAHGSAPDIMGQDKANPLAAIRSGALMLEYLAEKTGDERYSSASMPCKAGSKPTFYVQWSSAATWECVRYATEELEETAKLFLALRGMETRPLTQEQVDDLHKRYQLEF